MEKTQTRHQDLQRDIRQAVERGQDVQNEVRRITLKALAGQGLDTAAMRNVARSVSEGVQLGLERHGQEAKAVLEKAFAGLDEAFASAVEATTLTIQEASGNVRGFVKDDIGRVAEELKTLERLYLDTFRHTALHGRQFTSRAARQVAEHAERSGTAVGRQVEQSLAMLAPLGRIAGGQVQQGMHSALEAGTLAARAASGFLAGIADRMEAGKAREPQDKGS